MQNLGVTLRFKDDPPAIANLLQSQRQYRAALYIDRLEAAQGFLINQLNTAAPGGLGVDYPFVQAALARPELLNQLAAGLDEWVCPAVGAAVNAAIAAGGVGAATDYQTWFTADIFDPVLGTFNQNVADFFTQFPTTANALTRIRQNFENNIETALRRMLGDRAAITLLFSDRYFNLALTGLSEISSTGSDYHKGGQQVLIFTFTTQYWHGFRNWSQANSTLQLVYKPGDVEIDCLVAGESAAVNRATGGLVPFQAQSLAEIFNAWIGTHQVANAQVLPTYRILPRSPVSQHLGGPPYPVRQAYGYLEYLGYEFTGEDWSAFSFYPKGTSDYLIFLTNRMAPVISRFYRQAGQFLALALAFSLVDLHIENVRVTAYQPHLIDLEASLTANVTTVTGTSLLDQDGPNNTGGFNGESRNNEEFVYSFAVSQHNAPAWDMAQDFIEKWYANRLYAMLWSGERVVPVNVYWLLQGLDSGMNVIRAIQAAGGFAAWLGRAANVLVRILPLATAKWAEVRSEIYVTRPTLSPAPNPPVTVAAAVADAQLFKVTELFNGPAGAEPTYVPAAAPQVTTDLTSFDIPSFYHRVGSADILDSDGRIIPVPPQVTVDVHGVATLVNTNVGRNTYFAAPPTAARVVTRLNAIAAPGGGFAGLVAGYRGQILAAFGLVLAPADEGVLV